MKKGEKLVEDSDYKIKEIYKEKKYNKLAKKINSHFLQCWKWGEFKSNFGWEPHRIIVVNSEDNPVSIGQFLIKNLPLNRSFAYFPMGPSVNFKNKKILNKVLNRINLYIKNNFKKNVFIRYEMPIIEHKDFNYNESFTNGLGEFNLKKAPYDIQVRDTRKLKLSDEKTIWEDVFNSNHRRKIRKAFKSDVSIKDIKKKEEFDKWYQLNKRTAERGGFFIHPYRYYKKYYEKFIIQDISNLYAGYYNNKMVAGIIVSNYNNESIYQYGASKRLNKNIYINEALQWYAIKRSIKRGSDVYDFWGVAPDEDDRSHPWYGISRFKRKFGGEHIRYIGAYDYPQHKMQYEILIKMEKIRKQLLKLKKKIIR